MIQNLKKIDEYCWELPKTEPVFDLIADVDRTVLEMQEDWF